MEAKLKHLELIQGVVNRLASDSFRMKGWSVVLIAALFVLMAREGSFELAPIGFLPVVVFWLLDGYFLWQERLYRRLYDHVRHLEDSAVDFSMDVAPFKTVWTRGWCGATLSLTLVLFHGTLVAAISLFMVLTGLGDDA